MGIVGAGAVVRECHLAALRAQAGVRLAWIADPLPAARDRVAELCRGGVAVVDHPGDRLAGTDVVLVATPPAAHADRAVEALDAGCHVLCEKPLALDPDECRRVAAAADRAGRVATVAFNLRHHPVAQAMRAAHRAGTLGRTVAVRSCSSGPSKIGRAGWLGVGDAGGDVLWEVGSHHADLWRFVFGATIVEATGQASADAAVLTARTGDGTPISATITWGTPPHNELEVLGGRARARAAFYGGDPLTVVETGATGAEPGQRLRSVANTLRAGPSMVRAVRRGGAFQATYVAEWAAFLDAVRGRSPNPCPVEEGLAAVQAVRIMRAGCGLDHASVLQSR